MKKKILCLSASAAMLFGAFTQISAYEYYPVTSGGSKGTAELECVNLPKYSTKTSLCYTMGFSKPVGAYAFTKIHYSKTPSGTINTTSKTDTDDYQARVELKSPGQYPQKADYKNSANSHYYGSFSRTNTIKF